MKMKKLMALLMSSAMFVSALAGCGSGTDDAADSGDTASESTDDTADASEDSGSEDSGEKPYEGVELSFMVMNSVEPDGYEAVLDLAEEKLGIKVNVEVIASAPEGDNIVKTRLASGEMTDILSYNSGALLSAINPSEHFIDMTDSEVASTFDEAFTQAASVDGVLYGVPFANSSSGGVMYNKEIYEKYNLEVPETWDEFIANCDTLKEAGETALIGSFADVWTAQVPFLADNYALLQSEPDFPERFTEGTAKYATSEAGLRSWEKLEATHEYYNEDYLATTYNDACDMLVNGEGAQYIMLTQAIRNIYSLYGLEEANKIGFFPIPGDTPEETGMTVWASGALYGNKNSENADAVKAFLEWWVSDEAIDAYVAEILPDGPYHNGYELPEGVFDAVKVDMQKYIDEDKTALAMEFLTPVKGANCPQLCQELGSGQSTAAETAQAYDEDCLKQAVQLGLDWE